MSRHTSQKKTNFLKLARATKQLFSLFSITQREVGQLSSYRFLESRNEIDCCDLLFKEKLFPFSNHQNKTKNKSKLKFVSRETKKKFLRPMFFTVIVGRVKLNATAIRARFGLPRFWWKSRVWRRADRGESSKVKSQPSLSHEGPRLGKTGVKISTAKLRHSCWKFLRSKATSREKNSVISCANPSKWARRRKANATTRITICKFLTLSTDCNPVGAIRSP